MILLKFTIVNVILTLITKINQLFVSIFKIKKHQIYEQNINKIEDRLKISQLQMENKKLLSEVRLWKEKYLELDLRNTEKIDFDFFKI
jgi:hypothetical protein